MLPERRDTSEPITQTSTFTNLRFTNYSARYPGQSKPSLKNLNFEIKSGSLLGVIGKSLNSIYMQGLCSKVVRYSARFSSDFRQGPLGSGKSTLVNVLLDETEDFCGTKLVSKNISIAPQEAWIFEGSIRENILIGAKYDEIFYKQVLEAVCLIPDLNNFPHGDKTHLGYKEWIKKGYKDVGDNVMLLTL